MTARYSMDFTLVFAMPTDNPDPDAVSPEAVVAALRERVNELLKTDPENVLSEVWPPTVFDSQSNKLR